ncbi:innexin 7 isoform X2 [Calliopsis andreniformis]
MHYRATCLILLISCLLVSSRQYIGEHIRCISGTGVAEHVINTFCFFTSTYTVVKHMNATSLELGEIPHPGVGPQSREDPVVHHAYYQWVPFVLFFQAILFYVPHYLWRNAEGGRLKVLVSGLHMASLALQESSLKTENGVTVLSKTEKDEKVRQIRVSFLNRIHLNRPWAYYLGLCEVLNFINVLMQIYLTDWFLGGAFLNLGHVQSEPRFIGKMDPLDVPFPKVTKCIFHKYGPSGSIQQHDALCVMALNIVNEKIYVFLWYWFIILAVVTGLGLLWRILTMLLHARSTFFNKIVFSMACPGKYNPWNMLRVTHECHFGDWLFLYYIAKNLDNYVFKDLLEKLGEDLQERRQTYLRVPTKEEEALKQA